jgi:hypothetical protein
MNRSHAPTLRRLSSAGKTVNFRPPGPPIGSLVFSLAAPVPFGATINPTNGILRWTPNCTQASRTHAVTDTGNPILRDLRTFTVTTRECVVPALGRLVLQAGDSGHVPVNLISTVPLTNLSMTVEVPHGRLTNFSVVPIVVEICASARTPMTTPHGPLLGRGGSTTVLPGEVKVG